MKRFFAGLREMGFEKPRSAIALLPLSLFSFLYLLAAFMGDPNLQLAFGALSLCYLTAFLAVASEWFWARWFATGLGWSGAMVAVAAMVMMGEVNAALMIFGGLHALVVVMLMGSKMVARYDMQPGWRQRFGMDEFGVVRLRKAVTRASAALPSLILWALGPRQGQGGALLVVAAGLALLGLRGLVRLRTWGLMALAGSAVAVLVGGASVTPALSLQYLALGIRDPLAMMVTQSPGVPSALALLLLAATLPFAGGAVRYYRGLR
jgi:hypothetical protein